MKKGDLLFPTSDNAKKTWGRGIIVEEEVLKWPTSHLVFWFSHGRSILIEEEIALEQFDIIETDETQTQREERNEQQ